MSDYKYKRPFWVSSSSGGIGTIEGVYTAEEAIAKANEINPKCNAIKANILPYPASPKLWSSYEPKQQCPTFCWQPNSCQGKTCCPRPRACDD